MTTCAGNTGVKALSRKSYVSKQESSMPEIYRDDVNIAIWQRTLDSSMIEAAKLIAESKPLLQFSAIVNPQSIKQTLRAELGSTDATAALTDDIATLVDMFCFLFDLREAGLRIKVLDDAMCPRFHVDKVPCRLITTYCGIATEWLPNHLANRSKLGAGSQGKPDDESGIFENKEHIKQLSIGDVALLKGEHWHKNQGGGIVHRSPKPSDHQKRLLMTLDYLTH